MNISQKTTNDCVKIAKCHAHGESAQNWEFRFVKNDEIRIFNEK